MQRSLWPVLIALLVLVLPAPAHGGAGGGDDPATLGFVWDERAARHLLGRAGFGATPDEVRAALERTPAELIEDLLGREDRWVDVEPELFRWEMFGLDHLQLPIETTDYYDLDREDQVARCKNARNTEREQFLELYAQYFTSIQEHRDPLRDRMLLFWHGFFTTSLEANKRKFELIHQFQWLRRNALGSYADLLHGIVRDPAMLQYLDNTSNHRQHPNENLARELMELFSLGEGHYSERDVQEAARALTGHAGSAVGTYEFLPELHDDGEKTILGVTGPHDARDLVQILLERPECAVWVSRRLLRYFEGVDPEPGRLAAYAALLRDADYELRPFLRRLFQDPAFYREDIVGTRVHGPIEYLAAICRKLEVVPSSIYLLQALEDMGQALYRPPSVKGWPDGLAWMSTDSMIRRANCAGVLLGEAEDESSELVGSASSDFFFELGEALGDSGWQPGERLVAELRAVGSGSDAELAAWMTEAWLQVPDSPRARELMTLFLRRERELHGLEEGAWLDDPRLAPRVLRRAAHFLFSLPEAQLG